MNLLITFLFSLMFIIGVIIILIFKNTKRINELSISMAFGILVFLIFMELVPEAFEHLSYYGVLLCVLSGIILLKLLDKFVPAHHHSNKKDHVLHIGIITMIALIIHNLVEGMALYSSLESDFKMGLLLGIGIGLHNIPLGMIVASTFKKANFSNIKIILYSLLVSISTLIGAFIISVFNNINEITIGIMLSITLGMIVYITFFELFENLKNQDKNNNIIGILIGTLLFIISMLLGG